MKTVLVVDDSPTIRGFCKLCLRPLDVLVLEAEEGAQALSLLREAVVDLVIADVHMPGMDGLALLQALRADPNPLLRDIPVLLLTGERDQGIRERGLALGANAIVEKPPKIPALQEAVRKLLGGPP